MLYLICTMISSVDLAHYGVSRAKDWVPVDCGTIKTILYFRFRQLLIFGKCVQIKNKLGYVVY